MLGRAFFRAHSVLKILGVHHVIEGGQTVDFSRLKHGVYCSIWIRYV